MLQPDRGHVTTIPTNYRARSHLFNITFDAASSAGSKENVALQYLNTTLYREGPSFSGHSNLTTGLDPDTTREATHLSPAYAAAKSNSHISVDAEGLALDSNGVFQLVSDEYGPYIYAVCQRTGFIAYTIVPPAA